jgi:hypothetical protein
VRAVVRSIAEVTVVVWVVILVVVDTLTAVVLMPDS